MALVKVLRQAGIVVLSSWVGAAAFDQATPPGVNPKRLEVKDQRISRATGLTPEEQEILARGNAKRLGAEKTDKLLADAAQRKEDLKSQSSYPLLETAKDAGGATAGLLSRMGRIAVKSYRHVTGEEQFKPDPVVYTDAQKKNIGAYLEAPGAPGRPAFGAALGGGVALSLFAASWVAGTIAGFKRGGAKAAAKLFGHQTGEKTAEVAETSAARTAGAFNHPPGQTPYSGASSSKVLPARAEFNGQAARPADAVASAPHAPATAPSASQPAAATAHPEPTPTAARPAVNYDEPAFKRRAAAVPPASPSAASAEVVDTSGLATGFEASDVVRRPGKPNVRPAPKPPSGA